MSIDWLTVSAQVVNFLVLVWLLKRFLYVPVTEAVARRERHIADRLEQASSRERDAAEREARYAAELQTIERTRRERLAEVERAAEHERARLLEAARHEVAEVERGWRAGLAQEQREFLVGIRDELAAAVRHATARCLAELADAALEDRAVGMLIGRLAGLDADTRRALAGADWLVVACAFELDDERRARIERAVRAAIEPAGPVRFEHAPQLLLGIELRSPGTRVQWSAAEYLREAEQAIRDRIAAAGPEPHRPSAAG
ncbi:MAG: hypothetical protein JSW68_11265 [Burkholderiales bacterium]|nr:MAG: hypothetical protein JSW68_11265 [Burkholderiales bacterium]